MAQGSPGIQRKRATASARVEAIADQRKKLGFAVHADNDREARRQLDQLNSENGQLVGELQSLDGALIEAESRLQAARQALARDLRRAEITEQQKLSKQYREIGPFCDRSLENLRQGLIALKNNASVVGRDYRHVQTLHRVMSIAFFDTPFREYFGVPDSNDRRTFSTFENVINQWCDSTDAQLTRELRALDHPQTKGEAA
jgi:hypothetical protein